MLGKELIQKILDNKLSDKEIRVYQGSLNGFVQEESETFDIIEVITDTNDLTEEVSGVLIVDG